ncbi:MAG: SDR family NAD(P)-dependent oxidoreductase [Acidobacteria bacterium]|nr:MAG: SDR family NAD(P)-dependent oxidoreductase [Acidobacteriota bacterium]REJ99424.1 MAG: SDR family NAD(P)-dependent oxidoreductase [Acidobacteriota bacterium]
MTTNSEAAHVPRFLAHRALADQVALVAGATRGAGRGIARVLGQAGATVYCSGRSGEGVAATPGRPETIEETARSIEADGGRAVAVRVEHTDEEQVRDLVERIRTEQGRLDVVVNSIWGGDAITEWGRRFWEIDVAVARTLLERAVLSHLITSRHAAALMVEQDRGLIVEVTDGHEPGYRGQIVYDLVKAANIRLGYAMAWDLAQTGVTALTVTPGFLRSEAMLEHLGVDEASWRDAIAKDPFFAESETPQYVGRAVAAVAADPDRRRLAGAVFNAGELAARYGFTDVDGRTPRFFELLEETTRELAARPGPLDEHERFLVLARYRQVHLNPARREEAERLWRCLRLEDAGVGVGLLPASLGPE